MAKLDIIIPHYKEDIHLMDPMFAILRLQRNIKWTDFRVLIVCDGEDIILPEWFGHGEPFEVSSITVPHGGIAAARNAGRDYSQADWIMYCDSDDAFLTTTALQVFLDKMKDDKVMVASSFLEEGICSDGSIALLRHDCKDCVFIHGKAFRRSWLNDNNIRFNDEICLHEDVYFVALAKYHMAEKNIAYIKEPQYLWQYNPKSVTREKPNFVLRTYDMLCKKNSALVDELMRRGMFLPAKGIVCRTITDAYVRFHCKSWNTPENRELIADAEECVALFLRHYDYIFRNAGDVVIQAGLNSLRDIMIKRKNFDPDNVIPFEEWVEQLRK